MSCKLNRDATSAVAFFTTAFGVAHPAGMKGAAFCLGSGIKSLSEYGFDEEVGFGEDSITDATVARGIAHSGNFDAGAGPRGSCKGTIFLRSFVALSAVNRDSSSMISFKLLEAGDGVAKVLGIRDLLFILTATLLGFRHSSSMLSCKFLDGGVFTFTAVRLVIISGRG